MYRLKLCRPRVLASLVFRDTKQLCKPGRAMHSDFIERNIPSALSPRARECFLHFPKLTRGSRGQNTIRECAMSESNMIFGASVICALARQSARFAARDAKSCAIHAALVLYRLRISACKKCARVQRVRNLRLT